MRLTLLFFGAILFGCFIETQDALFTSGKSLQDVNDCSFFIFPNRLNRNCFLAFRKFITKIRRQNIE